MPIMIVNAVRRVSLYSFPLAMAAVIVGCSTSSTGVSAGGPGTAPGSTVVSTTTSVVGLKTSVAANVEAANKPFCEAAAATNDASFALGHKSASDPGYQEWLARFVEVARTNFARMAELAPPGIAQETGTLRDMFARADAAQLIGNPPDEASSAEEQLRLWVRTNCGFAWGIEGGDSSRLPGSTTTPSPGAPIRTVPPSTR
jgi:hypothetical protein